MGLLEEIFPGTMNPDVTGVPNWDNLDNPWDILKQGELGIESQISLFTGGDGVFVHPTAIIGDYVQIEGPSFIGAGAEIRHGALIRRGSWICDGALLGHCSEIKNSILLPGSKAPHFNYIGDSIVGFDVNLGAGAKISNVRNDRKQVLITMKDGTRVDSGLKKLGALIGDNTQIGCNVVTNPGVILFPDSMIPPNETVSGWFQSIARS